MNPAGSVTLWLDALRKRDPEAATALWQKYFHRLQALAKKRLSASDRVVRDEEDVALSTLDTFCRVFKEGRYPDLKKRDELWPLLAQMAVRKAKDQRMMAIAAKRTAPCRQRQIESVVDAASPPDVQFMMAEELQRLLDGLSDETHVQIAMQKLEGFANHEIADNVGCTIRTVQRVLGIVRQRWTAAVEAL